MRDFTLSVYKKLLVGLLKSGYKFMTFKEFVQSSQNTAKTVILRHDVDLRPMNALNISEIEYRMNVKATYYFRISNGFFEEDIIKNIIRLGHEIGYHYENLAEINRRQKIEGRRQKVEGKKIELENLIYERAIKDFKENLDKLRKWYPVKTICMHGSPLSKWDSRKLWEKYDYRDFGIIGEPYLDVDFSKVLYLTDTGRRWDGEKVNVRDKVNKEIEERREKIEERKFEIRNLKFETGEIKEELGVRRQESGEKDFKKNSVAILKNSFHSTFDIIKAAEEGQLPDKIMINVHPQRWNDKFIPWCRELVSQNVKNIFKRYFYIRNEKRESDRRKKVENRK